MDFTLLTEFSVDSDTCEEAIAQLCLGPKAATFEKPKDDFLHRKPLYLRGHINGKLTSRMLVDGGASVNLMPWSTCEKLDV